MSLLTTRNKRRERLVTAASAGLTVAAAVAGGTLASSRRVRALVFGKTRAAVNAATPKRSRDYDDVTLARKVETEIFRPADAPKGKVSVNAEHGVVYLRGQVKTVDQMKALEAAARKVEGVKDVDNLLHLPKTEPITKTEGKRRSLTAR